MPYINPVLQNIGQNDAFLWPLKQYILNNPNDIFRVINFKGGWERWFQGQIALMINSEFHQPIVCEWLIWNNKQKVDILAVPHGDEGIPHVAVELKCRTALSEGNTFANKFWDDIVKVAMPPIASVRPCMMFAVGITMDDEDCTTDYTVVKDVNGNIIPIYYDPIMQGLSILWVRLDYSAI